MTGLAEIKGKRLVVQIHMEVFGNAVQPTFPKN